MKGEIQLKWVGTNLRFGLDEDLTPAMTGA